MLYFLALIGIIWIFFILKPEGKKDEEINEENKENLKGMMKFIIFILIIILWINIYFWYEYIKIKNKVTEIYNLK